MTPPAVLVLVAGLVLVALIVGGALLAQRRRDRTPDPARSGPSWPARGPVSPSRGSEQLFVATEDAPPTDPITTRTAQADPPTVRHPAPGPPFGEGQRHPTPPPSGDNGRRPGP